MDVPLVITLPALLLVATNAVKALRTLLFPSASEDRRSAANVLVTLAVLILLSWGVLWLYANSAYASGVLIGGKDVGLLGAGDLLLAALAFAGAASFVFDLTKAFDNSNSARTVQLVPPAQPEAAPVGGHTG